jgi:hypothetical protein
VSATRRDTVSGGRDDGSSDSITSNQGVFLSFGATYRWPIAAGRLETEARLGLKYSAVSASNGDAGFAVFPIEILQAVSVAPVRLAAGVVDGDRTADAFLLSGENTVSVHRSNADGTFAPPIAYVVPVSTFSSFAVANLDRDGRADAVVVTGTLRTFRALGARPPRRRPDAPTGVLRRRRRRGRRRQGRPRGGRIARVVARVPPRRGRRVSLRGTKALSARGTYAIRVTDFGLPPAATHHLDADRDALGMDRLGYLVHLLYQRGLEAADAAAALRGALRSTQEVRARLAWVHSADGRVRSGVAGVLTRRSVSPVGWQLDRAGLDCCHDRVWSDVGAVAMPAVRRAVLLARIGPRRMGASVRATLRSLWSAEVERRFPR